MHPRGNNPTRPPMGHRWSALECLCPRCAAAGRPDLPGQIRTMLRVFSEVEVVFDDDGCEEARATS